MYPPKVDKAALWSAQKSRMEGLGLGSSAQKEHWYPSDLRGGGGSSPAGGGERDGRGDDSDDAYARVIAQLSLADGDVASEANDHTLPLPRGTATATNPNPHPSHHPTKASGSPTNHQQQPQQSATQRSSRSGLATLDEGTIPPSPPPTHCVSQLIYPLDLVLQISYSYLLASVSRLQSAAKLLERDLARGHRLQVTPLGPAPIYQPY